MTTETVETLVPSAPRKGLNQADSINDVRAVASSLGTIERQCEIAAQAPDVRAALQDCEQAQARLESIVRKLNSGSTAVTVNDLERWEKSFSDAKKVLMQLAPIFEQHPTFASMVAHN